MTRLFAGTPFDRPPRCERCDQLLEACVCPPLPPVAKLVDRTKIKPKLAVERRAKGKQVTVIRGLDALGDELAELVSQLKSECGSGGTLKDGVIELQGDLLDRARAALQKRGYSIR